MTIKTNIKKKLTVGVPFYIESNPEHLKLAIDSTLNQTLLPDSIHLIQDGPITEELELLVKKYSKKYSNIEVLSLPKKGLPYALNQSILKSKTKYYARMDADDISFETRFEKQVNYLETNFDVDIVGGWVVEFKDSHKKETGYLNKRPNNKKKIVEYFHYMSPLIHPTVIFRVEVFKKIGFYNEKFYTGQDLELWGRALRAKVNMSNIQEPLLYLRVQGRQERRSHLLAVKRQIKARYSYNTLSIRLNILKLASIFFRLLPEKIKIWCYRNLRK